MRLWGQGELAERKWEEYRIFVEVTFDSETPHHHPFSGRDLPKRYLAEVVLVLLMTMLPPVPCILESFSVFSCAIVVATILVIHAYLVMERNVVVELIQR